MMDWVSRGAAAGYVAAILCRSVQVERPSSSTSGGQSGVGEAIGAGALAFLPAEDFIIAIQAADEVQVRHLVLLAA